MRVYDRCCGVDHGREAGVGFAGAQGDPLEVLEFAEEVLDQVAPPVEVGVDRAGLCPPRVLGDHHLRTALIQFGDDPIDVEGLVGDQAAEGDALDERRDPTVS